MATAIEAGMQSSFDLEERAAVRACLLGTAVGDALGLPYEGLSAAEIAARRDPLDRFRLFFTTGFVSDDTEQSALVLASLVAAGDDVGAARRHFRRALGGWLCRMPFGVGWATLRAGIRMALGKADSGVRSAGNGAAMRSSVIGARLADDPSRRRAMARALSRVTHTDRRAVEGAVYAAELCALCVGAKENVDRAALALRALAPVHCAAVRDAIDEAVHLATLRDEAPDLVQEGYVVDTLRACVWAFVRHGEAPLDGIRAAIALGGDTDTAAAIVGAWLGTLHGESSLPSALVEALHDGPFGPTHLRALSHAGDASSLPVYSGAFAWARNLALFPVVLVHGLTRVLSTLDPLG